LRWQEQEQSKLDFAELCDVKFIVGWVGEKASLAPGSQGGWSAGIQIQSPGAALDRQPSLRLGRRRFISFAFPFLLPVKKFREQEPPFR
jgi:hypothetical protein